MKEGGVERDLDCLRTLNAKSSLFLLGQFLESKKKLSFRGSKSTYFVLYVADITADST